MTNYEIADQFTLLSKLSDIHGHDAFKVKQYSIAAYNIEKIAEPLAEMDSKTLYSYKGIGKSTGQKIEELLQHGEMKALTELIAATPSGVLEMLQIKGLGPKKIAILWKEMEIESIGELLYACNENRLANYKGFGAKSQQSIIDAIEFYQNAKGSFLYAQVAAIEPPLTQQIKLWFGADVVTVTGAYAMQSDTIDYLEYVVVKEKADVLAHMATLSGITISEEDAGVLIIKLEQIPLKLKFYIADNSSAQKIVFETSSSPQFLATYQRLYSATQFDATLNDENVFAQHQLPYLAPYLRHTTEALHLINDGKPLPKVIQPADIKGMIHNHSNWSDGVHTIEQMAEYCIEQGWEYLVISDHSKSAYYAQGLVEERIKEQHILIDKLNQKYAPFRIFKSIECDILGDGSLDYSDSILSTFDLVVASIHSNLKMTEEKAMQRIMAAIENPYTTILGHLSGRLLLSRLGYPLNYEQVIEACVNNFVAIELNAHPSRLDIDWSYIPQVLQADVLISINPDAHATDGFHDVKYGVLAAQKAMVLPHQNLSSFSLQEFEEYLYEVRERKLSS